jgi:hypothetical protein
MIWLNDLPAVGEGLGGKDCRSKPRASYVAMLVASAFGRSPKSLRPSTM